MDCYWNLARWHQLLWGRVVEASAGGRTVFGKRRGLAISPDSEVLVAVWDNGVSRAWNLQDWQPACESLRVDRYTNRMLFRPKSRQLARWPSHTSLLYGNCRRATKLRYLCRFAISTRSNTVEMVRWRSSPVAIASPTLWTALRAA